MNENKFRKLLSIELKKKKSMTKICFAQFNVSFIQIAFFTHIIHTIKTILYLNAISRKISRPIAAHLQVNDISSYSKIINIK